MISTRLHKIKKNMVNKLIDLKEKILLRKRNLIETVFDFLKNKTNLQHTRHRSPINAFIHILSKTMVMPGDNANLKIALTAPIAMEEGVRFAIREGGRTVGAGVVSKIIK